MCSSSEHVSPSRPLAPWSSLLGTNMLSLLFVCLRYAEAKKPRTMPSLESQVQNCKTKKDMYEVRGTHALPDEFPYPVSLRQNKRKKLLVMTTNNGLFCILPECNTLIEEQLTGCRLPFAFGNWYCGGSQRPERFPFHPVFSSSSSCPGAGFR